MKMTDFTFIGVDYWDRPVYRDPTGMAVERRYTRQQRFRGRAGHVN